MPILVCFDAVYLQKNEKQDWNFLTLNSAIKRIFKFNALFGAHHR